MAETETGAPKLGCTPWPYGRADDSAGADQTEDNLGSDGQTRDKWNIEEADQNTTHGSRNFQHRQRTESPGQDFHKTITITHSREIVKVAGRAVIHRQDLTII